MVGSNTWIRKGNIMIDKKWKKSIEDKLDTLLFAINPIIDACAFKEPEYEEGEYYWVEYNNEKGIAQYLKDPNMGSGFWLCGNEYSSDVKVLGKVSKEIDDE